MKVQRSSSDIINALPQIMIENILCRLPIQNAVRTSILSSEWRYSWTSIPMLRFEDKLFKVSSNSAQDKKHKFLNAIFQVLFLHGGSLLSFTLQINELNITSEIDPIILYLSMSNTLKNLSISNRSDNRYTLPSSLGSFRCLKSLYLRHCVFEPSLTFKGLGTLTSLTLYDVLITAKMLQRLLFSCPLLQAFKLAGQHGFREGIKFTFIELFECLPSVVQLMVYGDYLKYLVGGMPPKLSTPLVHLKIIKLGVCFTKQYELSSLLCLIRSSPNLEKIKIWTSVSNNGRLPVQQTSINFLDLKDHLSYDLGRLEDLEIEYFWNGSLEMEFVKLIMAKSPVLKKVKVILHQTVSTNEELKMFRDLVRYPLARASPLAKFTIERSS